tara:strand:- start:98 stop:1219 length:1122 start_codon:yes stop_codon:yes gene_type:complete
VGGQTPKTQKFITHNPNDLNAARVTTSLENKAGGQASALCVVLGIITNDPNAGSPDTTISGLPVITRDYSPSSAPYGYIVKVEEEVPILSETPSPNSPVYREHISALSKTLIALHTANSPIAHVGDEIRVRFNGPNYTGDAYVIQNYSFGSTNIFASQASGVPYYDGPAVQPTGALPKVTNLTKILEYSEDCTYKKLKDLPSPGQYSNLPNTPFNNIIIAAAKKHNVPVALQFALIKVESNFNPNAVSKSGAAGLGQFLKPYYDPPADKPQNLKHNAFDPTESANMSAKLLSQHLKNRGGNAVLALHDYNRGGGTTNKLKDMNLCLSQWQGTPAIVRKNYTLAGNPKYSEKILRYYELYEFGSVREPTPVASN